jgi:hypothetical protein
MSAKSSKSRTRKGFAPAAGKLDRPTRFGQFPDGEVVMLDPEDENLVIKPVVYAAYSATHRSKVVARCDGFNVKLYEFIKRLRSDPSLAGLDLAIWRDGYLTAALQRDKDRKDQLVYLDDRPETHDGKPCLSIKRLDPLTKPPGAPCYGGPDR